MIFCHYQKFDVARRRRRCRCRCRRCCRQRFSLRKQVMLPQIKSTLYFAVLPKRVKDCARQTDEFMELLLLMCYSLTSFVDFSLSLRVSLALQRWIESSASE